MKPRLLQRLTIFSIRCADSSLAIRPSIKPEPRRAVNEAVRADCPARLFTGIFILPIFSAKVDLLVIQKREDADVFVKKLDADGT